MDFDKRLNDHIEGVKNYLKVISILLDSRGLMHDSTKKSDEEYNYYKMANSVSRNDFKKSSFAGSRFYVYVNK